MSNLSYQKLLEKYKETKEENKKLKKGDNQELVKTKESLNYYYYAYKKQSEENKEMKDRIKVLEKEKIELSILVDYLRGEYNGRI
jgi:hypothetical protein